VAARLRRLQWCRWTFVDQCEYSAASPSSLVGRLRAQGDDGLRVTRRPPATATACGGRGRDRKDRGRKVHDDSWAEQRALGMQPTRAQVRSEANATKRGGPIRSVRPAERQGSRIPFFRPLRKPMTRRNRFPRALMDGFPQARGDGCTPMAHIGPHCASSEQLREIPATPRLIQGTRHPHTPRAASFGISDGMRNAVQLRPFRRDFL
jgi:hypothetical protein